MANRGYSLIDFTLPSGLWPDRDRVVRFMEFVRTNFHRIVKGVPAECEVDLFAGGHAHNPELVPLLGLWAPAAVLGRVPSAFRMIDEVSEWCSRLPPDEVERIVAATAAPTWDELVRIRVHPTCRSGEDEQVGGAAMEAPRNVGDEPLDISEFSLVYGPRELVEPAFSFADERVEIYTPQEIAAAILAAPGVKLANAGTAAWSEWRARWEDGNRFIELDMLVCPIDPGCRPGVGVAWAGSGLRADCRLGDLLDVWTAIRSRCPGVWMHGTDCRLYSPESFAAAFGGRDRHCT